MKEIEFLKKNAQMKLKREKKSVERIDKILSRLTCFNSEPISQELVKEVRT